MYADIFKILTAAHWAGIFISYINTYDSQSGTAHFMGCYFGLNSSVL